MGKPAQGGSDTGPEPTTYECVPGPNRSASLCLGFPNYGFGGAVARTDWGRTAVGRTAKGRRGVRRVEAETSPVLGQLEVARAQEFAQHRVVVCRSR